VSGDALDGYRLRSDTCFRCFATGVHLVMTGRVELGTRDEEAFVFHCMPCFALAEAERRLPGRAAITGPAEEAAS
jgi:hypothetical protein